MGFDYGRIYLRMNIDLKEKLENLILTRGWTEEGQLASEVYYDAFPEKKSKFGPLPLIEHSAGWPYTDPNIECDV